MVKLFHKVPNIPCFIEYDIEPDSEYIKRFTDLKAANWSEIGGPVDAYIGDSAMEYINASSTRRRRRRAKHRHVYQARVQSLIDYEVNRGLAIISLNDRVEIKRASGFAVVNKQYFEQAMGRLFKAMHGSDATGLSYKKRQARYWADSCAYEIGQAFFGRRLKK